MPQTKLTKTVVDKATYEGTCKTSASGKEIWTRCFLWDQETPGFGLRIYPSGRKSYVLRYQARGRERLITLGAWTKLTVQAARAKAYQHLGNIALLGSDPLAERRQKAREERSRGLTVKKLADRYMKEYAEVHKKASSVAGDRQMLDAYILPKLGRLEVTAVSRKDATALHASLAQKPYAANRTLALLSRMFTLAEKWELRPDHTNPCRHVEKYPEKPRERYLSLDELRRLAQALESAEASGEDPHGVAAIRLLLFTGCRRGEILNLRWQDVDLDRRLLRLPDSKTGQKTVFLSSMAVSILRGLPRTADHPYVIEGREDNCPLYELRGPWNRVRSQADLEDLRLHDLRHSFAATGAGLGLSLRMLGKLMGHTQQATTDRYAHFAAKPMHSAVDLIGDELERAMATDLSAS